MTLTPWLSGAPSASADALDEHISTTLHGDVWSLFLSELVQGVGQLALMLLLLEVVLEWPGVWRNPDPWLLLAVAVGQSAWLARVRQRQQTPPAGGRLWGLLVYATVEGVLEGARFFVAPHHLTFAVLSVFYALGMAMEHRHGEGWLAVAGTVLARLAQALGPVLYYVALDLHGSNWLLGVQDFLSSPAHAFLFVLALAQAASLVVLTLTGHRQSRVIGQLVQLLKQLSRWGYGDRVVSHVLRQGGAVPAQRVDRVIAFIDVRGFTAWSECHSPEQVVAMLNTFYAAVLQGAGPGAMKVKLSGDEALLVFPLGEASVDAACGGLAAARTALAPWGLDAGAGLWQGPVIEGFFGARDAPVHDVIGDSVNTAHRLCSQARAGQMLLGPIDVHPVRVADASPIWIGVKGKSQPVGAWVKVVP